MRCRDRSVSYKQEHRLECRILSRQQETPVAQTCVEIVQHREEFKVVRHYTTALESMQMPPVAVPQATVYGMPRATRV
jgi:hypothetical protein